MIDPHSQSSNSRKHGGRRPGAGRPSSQIPRLLDAIRKYVRPDLGTDVYAVSTQILREELGMPCSRISALITRLRRAGRLVCLAPARQVPVSERARDRGDTRYERRQRRYGVYAIHPSEFAGPLDCCVSPKGLSSLSPFSTREAVGETVPIAGSESPLGEIPNSSSEVMPRWLWEMGVTRRFDLLVTKTLDDAFDARSESYPPGRFTRYRESLTQKMLRRFEDGVTPEDLILATEVWGWDSRPYPLLYAWGWNRPALLAYHVRDTLVFNITAALVHSFYMLPTKEQTLTRDRLFSTLREYRFYGDWPKKGKRDYSEAEALAVWKKHERWAAKNLPAWKTEWESLREVRTLAAIEEESAR